ncbi:hypothetical protein SLEP1_g53281 [Rubroshorea leprosula]|uniref:Uncharacterized protein n=1 Tax=Rubroshorea leprosula TaxID=152421 RepID=A0AAV5MAR5_9ROSI|nr:hypothetical protein SLEP1_g53281 [Rubroshorea leprosula]
MLGASCFKSSDQYACGNLIEKVHYHSDEGKWRQDSKAVWTGEWLHANLAVWGPFELSECGLSISQESLAQEHSALRSVGKGKKKIVEACGFGEETM